MLYIWAAVCWHCDVVNTREIDNAPRRLNRWGQHFMGIKQTHRIAGAEPRSEIAAASASHILPGRGGLDSSGILS